MPILPLDAFSKQTAAVSGRFLGLDVGEKTIGLALTDKQRKIASPLEVIHRTKWQKDAATLKRLLQEHEIVGLVVGLPLNMDGTEGPRCQSIRTFVANFMKLADLPFCLWDERLSTVAVTRTLLEADLSRQKRAKVIDKMAATYILQNFLDALNHH